MGPITMLTPSHQEYALENTAETWLDHNSELTPEKVMHTTASGIKGSRAGYTLDTVWTRTRIENRDPKHQRWVLSMEPPLVDGVDLFLFDASNRLVKHSHYEPKGPRGIDVLPERRPAFSLNLPLNQKFTLIFKVTSSHQLNMHLLLATPEQEARNREIEQLVMGAYYGIFLAILLINLFIYLAILERSYLHYVLFTSALWLQLSTLSGFLDYHSPWTFLFSNYLCAMCGAVVLLAHQFTRSYLETPVRIPRMDYVHKAMIVVSAALALLNFAPFFPRFAPDVGHALDICIGLSVVSIFVSACLVTRQRFRPAMFFLLSWSALLGMTSMYFLATYGMIAANHVTGLAIQIGSSIEMVLLTIALAYRIYLLKKEQRVLKKQAQESERLRSLVHMVCHDLRNPLSVILSQAELNSRRGGEKASEDWSRISKAALQQKNILDYVRTKEVIDTGKARFCLEPIELYPVIENARFMFDTHLQKKKLNLVNHLTSDDRHLCILGDPITFGHSVLANLISNAIKFSHEGRSIRVGARVTSDNRVELIVEDEGIGIPQDILSGIFSLNTSKSRYGTHGEEGTGLGMPLVQTLVSAMGGEVQIHSRINDPSGTTVRILMPKAPSFHGAEKH